MHLTPLGKLQHPKGDGSEVRLLLSTRHKDKGKGSRRQLKGSWKIYANQFFYGKEVLSAFISLTEEIPCMAAGSG